MAKRKLQIGDKVSGTIQRTGGAYLEVTGTISGFETGFGRLDVVLKDAKIKEVVINEKNVALVK